MVSLRCVAQLQTLRHYAQYAQRRTYASHASVQSPSKTRNLAVVAHIDSGKTTLTESILWRSGYLAESGSVDTGSTTTDFLPAERARGITIQSASVPVKWRDWHFNLIDTPGHADFGMEVESASRVVDGAIVLIDSVEGVEAQTKGVWQQLNRYGVPTRILFMNKLDRPGSSYYASMLSILAHRIHPKPMAVTLPVASFEPKNYKFAESGIEGVIDLVKMELWKWDTDRSEPSRYPLTVNGQFTDAGLFPPDHPLLPEILTARAALLENLSMFSEDLMEQLLELDSNPSASLAIAPETIITHLRAATLRNDILPVFCGSAIRHVGTEIVLDYAGELLASPLDVTHDKQTNTAPVRALAWKVAYDKKKGWMTFVRVYSGTIRSQSILYNPTRNAKERVSKLQLLYANEAVEVTELPFGSVGVLLGLRATRTGDTLMGHGKNHPSKESALRNITPPPAVMASAVVPHSHSDLAPVEEALQALSRTDPSVRVETHEGQLLAHGLGALHLEIVEGRLRDEWNVNFEFGKRIVSYREGLGHLDGSHSVTSWSGHAHGTTVGASIQFSLQALDEGDPGDPAWNGNAVLGPDRNPLPGPDTIFDDHNLLAQIARGVSAALSNSPHTSLPLSGTSVHITSYHLDSGAPASILAGASAFILQEKLRAHGPGPLMEPYISLDISVTEDTVGRVVKDLHEHRGEVLDLAASSTGAEDSEPYPQDGVYIPPQWMSPSTMDPRSTMGLRRQSRSIMALAPLSQMLDYPVRLRALSGGHGRFEMMSAGFRVVNDARKMEILREIGRA